MNPATFLSTTFLCASFAIAAPAYAQIMATTATVTLRAEPGNYVGYSLDPAGETWTHGVDGVFRSYNRYGHSAYIDFWGDESWSFTFDAPKYDPVTNTVDERRLQVGRYDNATRSPFNSPVRPGMDISGDSRGNNRLSGWFDIKEVTYDSADNITSLWVDFAQYGENLTQSGPGLFGTLRFNAAAIAAPVPDAASSAQFALGLAGLGLLFAARRRNSI